jgi:hypothetical protein
MDGGVFDSGTGLWQGAARPAGPSSDGARPPEIMGYLDTW